MDNIESYIWLFCLDHPDTNITQVSDFIEWIFVTGCYIFSHDQAALRTPLSVCPSVCLSHLFHYVPFIVSSWNFQELLPMTKVMSMEEVEVRGQRSRSRDKKSPILTQIGRFRTVTPVWIYQWLRNDAQSLKWVRRGALLFFKVIHQISRSHGSKNHRIWPRLGVSGL